MMEIPSNAVLMGIPVRRDEQRKASLADYTPPPHAVVAKAACCGIEVWLGPRQQAMRAQRPATTVMCARCCAMKFPAAKTEHLGGTGGTFNLPVC